jgi:hypothetical protein
MTPLAHQIAKEVIGVAGAKLRGRAGAAVQRYLAEAVFFEVSCAWEAAHAIHQEAEGLVEALSLRGYLPAPVTWLEWKAGDHRLALVLVEDDRQTAERRDFAVYLVHGGDKVCECLGAVLFSEGCAVASSDFPWGEKAAYEAMGWALSHLNVLNTPSLIRPRRVAPHSGLARTLAQRGFMSGKFPLQGYTEVTLRPGALIAGKGRNGTSGDRCLHFVRRHERRVHGVWTVIEPHWRGDASLGIRLTRYSVTPPRKAA